MISYKYVSFDFVMVSVAPCCKGGQCEIEGTALSRQPVALYSDLPSQLGYDALHDRQAQPVAFGAPLVKPLEWGE
jgi:hypothetical protein